MTTKEKIALLLSFQLSLTMMLSSSQAKEVKVTLTQQSSYFQEYNDDESYNVEEPIKEDKKENNNISVEVDIPKENTSNETSDEISQEVNENLNKEPMTQPNYETGSKDQIDKNKTISEEESIVEEQPIKPELSIIDKILLDSNKLGSAGRLYFNNLFSVAIYAVSLGENAQEIVDNKDSAAIFEFGNILVIADHTNQGFNIIKKSEIGDLIYIKGESDNIDSYQCIERINGINTGTELITSDGRNVREMEDCDIVMYTCNSSWKDITITRWIKEKVLEKVLVKK